MRRTRSPWSCASEIELDGEKGEPEAELRELELLAAGRPRLFGRWLAASGARGCVVIVHGYGEHGGRYLHVMERLRRAGYSALAVDCRGWGRSEGRPAFVRSFEEYLDDVELALSEARKRSAPETPAFVLGHSQGGLVSALLALERSPGLKGLVLVSPFFRLALRVPAWKHALALLASRLVPTLSLPSGMEPKFLTHDREMLERLEQDPLVVTHATASWYTACRVAQERALQDAPRLRTPTLVLGAGSDHLVDEATIRAFVERVRSGRRDVVDYRRYPDFYHEILNEVGRERALDDVVHWMDARAET